MSYCQCGYAWIVANFPPERRYICVMVTGPALDRFGHLIVAWIPRGSIGVRVELV
jgi:hypothetical protein